MNRSVSLLIVSLFVCLVQSHVNYNDTSVKSQEKSVVLSRRKRFLIFPEGSSFQMVFCLTYPTIFAVGDIFLWGATAALAWELPQDPYSPFDHHADPLHRRMDTKMIYYTSEEGKIIYKRPYNTKRKLIVNPAFAKRSVDNAEIKKGTERIQIDREQMHASQNKREFLNEASDRRSVGFHRSARAALYQKIETMLSGYVLPLVINLRCGRSMRNVLNKVSKYIKPKLKSYKSLYTLGTDGKQCTLKTLCIVGKTREDPQGSFLVEILRATFTLPQGVSQDDLDEYDAAFSAKETCDELYPNCEESTSEPVFRI